MVCVLNIGSRYFAILSIPSYHEKAGTHKVTLKIKGGPSYSFTFFFPFHFRFCDDSILHNEMECILKSLASI